MASYVASVVCALFILYLFWIDLRRPNGLSLALWVPLAWMFLAGSRWVSSWLNLTPTLASANDYSEGSPLDRAVFFGLIVAGIIILAKRPIEWSRLIVNNKWIALYLLYCLASIVWTDEPFVLLKRWIKDLGNPIMALVILTERRPYEAVATILRRLAFLLLPLSVLFIRYYPELGRTYHNDGSPMYTGVGHQKNDLGLMCQIAGIYLSWEILLASAKHHATFVDGNRTIVAMLVVMLTWLLYMSNSQTSFVCLLMAIVLMLVARTSVIKRRPTRLVAVVVVVALGIGLFNEVPHAKEFALGLLGRNPTLTNRTELWETLQNFRVNPIIGVGFMSFWSGTRLEEVWRLLGGGINQAHNGYLEQILNLGYVGLAFIIAIMLSGLLKIRRHLRVSPAAGVLRLSFIIVAVLYNYTEASFYGMNNMWMLLLLGCLEVPHQQQAHAFRATSPERPTARHSSRSQPPPRHGATGPSGSQLRGTSP
jgi:exopolysaccharide production protein ExoQ